MTPAAGGPISEAVGEVFRRAGYATDPDRRGPVPLDRLFQAMNVVHLALPGLRLAAIAEHLLRERYVFRRELLEDMLSDQSPLTGLLFWVRDDGLAFVAADDILPRRRFTAAHELGHAVLHRERMGRFISDPSVSESGDAVEPMEREANRFAAELLMPEEVLRARADELKGKHGVCPRPVLAYRLASELLVSREAIRNHLEALEVGDE
jgi:Zn-dependent peptidase ImmA (M78 family)